jgi:hypothetical protein
MGGPPNCGWFCQISFVQNLWIASVDWHQIYSTIRWKAARAERGSSQNGGPKYIHNNKLCAKNTPMGRDNPSKTSVISRVLRAARWWTLGWKNCTIKGRGMFVEKSHPRSKKNDADPRCQMISPKSFSAVRGPRWVGRPENRSLFVCRKLHLIRNPLLAHRKNTHTCQEEKENSYISKIYKSVGLCNLVKRSTLLVKIMSVLVKSLRMFCNQTILFAPPTQCRIYVCAINCLEQ